MIKASITTLSCLFAILITTATCCSTQSHSIVENSNAKSPIQTKADKIKELVGTYAAYGKFNGTVLVAEKGNVIYKDGFGLANIEWDTPNHVDTKFRLASVTKQFTAMLIMQLVAEKKLALDVPITTYLPTYPKETGDKINIHHLLTHTSGIPNYTSFPGYWDMMRNPMTPDEIINIFADSTLQFTPGEKFNYSNSAYVLLGVIMEKVTGKPFENILQEKILTPLKMTNTGYDNHKVILKNRATGYYYNAGTYLNSNYINMSVAFTAGGMYTTIEDLYLWDQALYTSTLLPNKYLEMVFTKHIPAWGQHYGYGWNISEMTVGNTKDKINTIDHDGVINGFNSLILRIPEDHSTILLLSNTGGAPLYEISRAISGILYDKPYDFPKQSVAHALLKSINEQNITKGIAFYQKIKADNTYYLDEREMNMVSYELLQSDRGNEAAEVLKLAIAEFPNAFNLFDSYAEVQRKLSNKEEAIKNYLKSVHLNPKNDNGLKMLKELGIDIDKESLYMLNTDKSWTKEIFTFPLHFAKDLDYQGIEEAHFPKGWRKQDSHEFWSYAFAWKINLDTELSKTEMEAHIQSYFDGLMGLVNKNKELVVPKTIAKLNQNEGIDNIKKFSGTIKMHDSFVTEKNMLLHVTAERHICSNHKKSILLFRFSPKAFGTDIWLELNKITLRNDMCEN